MTGGKWPPSETSTNVDLRAGKIMHNTFLKRRATVASDRRSGALVGVQCSHKFAIMQMPGGFPAYVRSRSRASFHSVAYFTASDGHGLGSPF